MSGLRSSYNRIVTGISGLCNAFFGQTRSRARLNAIASYDQSNDLFKVRDGASLDVRRSIDIST